MMMTRMMMMTKRRARNGSGFDKMSLPSRSKSMLDLDKIHGAFRLIALDDFTNFNRLFHGKSKKEASERLSKHKHFVAPTPPHRDVFVLWAVVESGRGPRPDFGGSYG
ncbi:unnamed protein product [Somion occarium]